MRRQCQLLTYFKIVYSAVRVMNDFPSYNIARLSLYDRKYYAIQWQSFRRTLFFQCHKYQTITSEIRLVTSTGLNHQDSLSIDRWDVTQDPLLCGIGSREDAFMISIIITLFKYMVNCYLTFISS